MDQKKKGSPANLQRKLRYIQVPHRDIDTMLQPEEKERPTAAFLRSFMEALIGD